MDNSLEAMFDPRLWFERYKAEGLIWSLGRHPDYEGCYLAEDKVLNIRAMGDTIIDAAKNLKDVRDKFVETILDSEDEEAIERLIVDPILTRFFGPEPKEESQ